MTAKIKVTLGGEVGATVLEYTDVVPFQSVGDNTPRWNLAMRCANGEDAQGTFIIDDDAGAIPKADGTRNIAAHNVVELTEDASGTEYTLIHGRISPKSVARNEALPWGDAIQHTITVDAPGDLRLLQLTEDWERSAETDYARLVALQAYTLNGASSTATHYSNTTTITVDGDHLAPNTNTVSMPAKTYPAGTPIRDIIQDCADSAGKIWSEVMHHVDGEGSHRCLLYILESDHTTYLSTVAISDDPDEIDPVADPPTIAPTWLQGSAAELDGQELITGLIVRYGSGDKYTFVESADSTSDIASYDYAVDTYYDDVSVTAEQAADKGVAIVRYRSKEHVTHQPSIKIRADHAHLIAAGMSITIKSAAAMGGQYLGTTQTRRIAQVEYEPCAPEVGDTDAFYWAHLELDRALRRSPYGKGNKATTIAPKPSPTKNTPTTELSVLWDYEEGNTKDTTGTYNFTDEVVDSPGAMSSHWGHVDPPENAESSKMPCAEGQLVHLTADVAAQTLAQLQTRYILVKWYQSIGDVNGDSASPTAVSNPCSAGAGVVGKIDQSWTVPAGITYFSLFTSHGVYVDNIAVTVTEPAAEDDPEARDEDLQGDSPYYLRSDDKIPSSQVIYGGQPLDTTLDDLVGADNAEVYSFAAAPTTGDDSDDGYQVGDLWVDTSATPDDVYILTDATVGSAVWKKLGGGGALDDLSDVDTTTTAPTDGQALIYDSDDSTWKPGDAGSALAVEDSDASVTDSAVTKLVFPDGTLAIASHIATITLPSGAAAATIGDGSATSFAVAHNLGTTDIIVQLWDLTGTDPVEATADASSITATDDDTVTVVFGTAPAEDAYRVVVLSRGASSGGSGGGGGGATGARYPVQEITAAGWGNRSSASATLDATPTSGNVLILVSTSEGGTNISSITQTNVAWSKLAETPASTAPHCEIWKGVVSASAGTGITVTYSGSTYCGFHVSEWTDLSGALDQSATATGASGGYLPTITPTSSAALVIAGASESTYGNGFTGFESPQLMWMVRTNGSGGRYAVAFGFPGAAAVVGSWANSHGGTCRSITISVT